MGRVLVSIEVEAKSQRDDGSESAQLALTVTGDETSDVEHRFAREVAAEDPEDLGSPMRYSIGLPGDRPAKGGRTATAARGEALVELLLQKIAAEPGLSGRELRELLKLGRDHALDALEVIRTRGLCVVEPGERNAYRYFPMGSDRLAGTS